MTGRPLFHLHHGRRPVLISIPHDGGWIPGDILARLRPEFHHTPDRDWHVTRLYDWAVDMGFSVIRATVSRYVVDLNRPADNSPLYPGVRTPGVCPLTDFSGQPLYLPGQKPDTQSLNQRLARYWRPYHQALESELQRLRQRHQQVLLWDAHSIRSRVPALFSGRLPDFNLGSHHGHACAEPLQKLAEQSLRQYRPRSVAVNGRFVGGHITRHYGHPDRGVHALQMEISQRVYLDENRLKLHHGFSESRHMLRHLLVRLADSLEDV